MLELFGQLGGAGLGLVFVIYVRSILKGKTKPKRATWLGYAMLDTAVWFVLRSQHTDTWLTWVAAFGSWIIFLLSLKFGEKGWKKLDVACICAAIVSAFLYWKTKNMAELSLLIGIAGGFAASVPTYVWSWEKPEDEYMPAWLLGAVAASFSLMGLATWTVLSSAQPWSFFFINSIEIAIILMASRKARLV